MGSPTYDIETLRKAYCPPIDDAVFYAISSDYDLPQDRAQLVGVLNGLKDAALEQEDTEFDPSGTGGPANQIDTTNASRSSPEDGSTSNGVTSITTDLSDLRWASEEGIGKELEDLSDEDKRDWLGHLFPNVAPVELDKVLKRSTSLEQATDELLNLAFLSNDPEDFKEAHFPVPKGIDGFAQEALTKPRKGRSKKKTRTDEASRASSSGSFRPDSPTISNVWASVSDDVDFICSRTMLQPQTVKSIYHANGARLAPTIRALASKGSTLTKMDEIDTILQLQIAEFKQEFPSVPEPQLYGLLVLARNIPSAACELAEAMILSTDDQPLGKVHGLAQYAPLDLEKENKPFETRTEERWTTVNYPNTRDLVAAHNIAAGQAFSQASAAYRRGKSDRLMGGVAAYYSSVGHERMKAAKELHSTMANAHVAAQSSANVLDLHGVSVADAVRIASNRTQAWWDGLGEAKYVSGGGGPVRAGYKIVTGVGMHSKNHMPRIGPAVSKMLVREGWRVEVGHGELVVTGKVKK